jgi:2-polyprenyl-6-methoxyphenol hydroxylase-like FAD-dependent oxidoreductase
MVYMNPTALSKTRKSMSETTAPVDFLIVGAGPVGLLTAILLGREGWRVTVIEKWPSRYPMPRACTIDHEALRILQGVGVMRDHADLFEPSRGERGGYQLRNRDGLLLQAINWNRTAESGWANTNGFYQPDLEAVLESMALALPSVELRRGWSAMAVLQNETSVRLTVARTDDDAQVEYLGGHWLIGADGANSVVRKLAGIDSVDTGFEADWLVVDYEPLDDRPWDAFVTQYCDPEQPATAVNSGPGRRRFEFMRRADVTIDELNRVELAWSLMEPWGVTPETARLERHAVYTFRGRWAEEWRRGRVLLAGDSAHLMPPFLGQGLCSGLRDASSLAWRLTLVEAGRASVDILDSYGTERGSHVREIIAEAVAIGQVICELDATKAAERDARMLAELVDPSAITVEPPHPKLGQPSITETSDDNAGRLSLQAIVEMDGVSGLFDDVVGGSWQLIALDDDPRITPELRTWFASLGGTITTLSADGPVRDIHGSYHVWFQTHGCSVVLSRPDFYIFGTGRADDSERLLHDLRSAIGGAAARTSEPIEEGALS